MIIGIWTAQASHHLGAPQVPTTKTKTDDKRSPAHSLKNDDYEEDDEGECRDMLSAAGPLSLGYDGGAATKGPAVVIASYLGEEASRPAGRASSSGGSGYHAQPGVARVKGSRVGPPLQVRLHGGSAAAGTPTVLPGTRPTGMGKEKYIRMVRLLVREGVTWRGRRWSLFKVDREASDREDHREQYHSLNDIDTPGTMPTEIEALVEGAKGGEYPNEFAESWVKYLQKNMVKPKLVYDNLAQEIAGQKDVYGRYPTTCRENNIKLLEGTYQHLKDDVSDTRDHLPSNIILYEPGADLGNFVAVYYHGGGLRIGDADSEAISCRYLAKHGQCKVYSVGYRLLSLDCNAEESLEDAIAGYDWVKQQHHDKKILLVGVSSGGMLAAQVSQLVDRTNLYGVLLRNPVTFGPEFDGPEPKLDDSGKEFLEIMRNGFADKILQKHQTQLNCPGFANRKQVPGYLNWYGRGIDFPVRPMPVEYTAEELKGLPKTWIQLCTNDPLFGDGLYYAYLLEKANVKVEVDVWKGFPHCFFHQNYEMEESKQAEKNVVDKGLKFIQSS